MRVLIIVLLTFLAASLAGCGGDDEAASTSGGSPSEADAFPVTIEHARGSTTIESPPERVVTVGLRDQEPLLALGVKAVGAMDWFQRDTFAQWPWQKEAWDGRPPEIVSTGGFDINFEKVAAQRPDLILALYQDLDRDDYGKLSKIAPTVAQSPEHEPYTTPWREETLTAAAAVGRKEEGRRLIADVDAKFAEARKQHPEFKGQEAVVVDAGTGEVFAFTSGDPRGQFLSELGFTNPPAIDKASKDGFGASISNERLDLIDVDRVFLLSDKDNRQKILGKPEFRELDVYKRGDVVELPYYDLPQYGAAVAFNSVLSIPYAIDGTLEQIAAAERR